MVHVVRGAIKDYDWGVVDGLAPWTGVRSGQPQAELWFGVHPSGPSDLLDHAGVRTGEILADHFDIDEIPLLVKILAAAEPLSLQVHPGAQLARDGWQSGRTELFTDPFEKTEMIVALGDFEALAGWRDVNVAAEVLESMGAPAAAIAALQHGDRHECLRIIAAMSPDDVRHATERIREASATLDDASSAALVRIAEKYPNDPGALAAVLLQHQQLQRGDALFVPCGVPHSYIHGLGFEVMTSSDNVLRLGLTSKTVAIDTAIEALNDNADAIVERGTLGMPLHPTGAPFTATLLEDDTVETASDAYRIIVCLSGTAQVSTDVADVVLRPGTAAVLTAVDPKAQVSATGTAMSVRWGAP